MIILFLAGMTSYVDEQTSLINSSQWTNVVDGINYAGGNVGVGLTPTAVLNLKAGTSTNPPFKLSSGTLLTTPITGSIEFADNRFYITNKNSQKAIDRTSDIKLSTTTVENTLTETEIYKAVVPANSWVAGNVLDMKIFGYMSNSAVANDVTLRVKVGGTTIATVTTNGKKLTDTCWEAEGKAIIRTVGESGTMAWTFNGEVAGEEADYDCEDTGTYDTTGALDITVTAQWDATNSANIFKCIGGFTEYKN
jgi:hypothetical protein